MSNLLGGIGALALSIVMLAVGEGTALILMLPIGITCTIIGAKELIEFKNECRKDRKGNKNHTEQQRYSA